MSKFGDEPYLNGLGMPVPGRTAGPRVATNLNPARRAAVEAGRLSAQASITMQAAIDAGLDLDREVSAALLVLDRWARRLGQPTT